MNIPLEQIITQGGPVGFALMFAWLWLRSEKKIERLDVIITELNSEMKAKQQADIDYLRALEKELKGV